MNEILHANIFFVIASVATVLFCVFVCFILYHAYKIVRSLRRIVERIEEGSEVIADDVAFVRNFMRGGVARILGLFGASPRARSRKGKAAESVDTQDDE